jgi:hypothetical protein
VRNAEAAGEVTLKKGKTQQRFRLRSIPDANKPEILKAYLDNFKREVQRYFPFRRVPRLRLSSNLRRIIPRLN